MSFPKKTAKGIKNNIGYITFFLGEVTKNLVKMKIMDILMKIMVY